MPQPVLYALRWLAVAAAAVGVGYAQQQLSPAGQPHLSGTAFGVPLAAGLVLGRWGWTAVLAGGLLAGWGAAGWAGVVAATATAGFVGWRCRAGWPFVPGLGWLTDVGKLARLAVEAAAVRGLLTAGLYAARGSDWATEGPTAATLSLAAGVMAAAVAGAAWAGAARPLLALVPPVLLTGVMLAGHLADGRQPLADGSAAVWWAVAVGVAGLSLGMMGVAAAARERLAEAALRDRLLADLKAVSADLIRRRAAMEALLDQLPVGVLFLDADGRVVRQNRHYRDVLKLPTDFPELCSDGPTDSGRWQVARADGTPVPAAEWSVYRAVRAGQVATEKEARVRAEDGTWREVSVSSAPVSLPDGDHSGPGAVFVVADLTARRQAERGRREAEDRLRSALASARMYAWEWDAAADAVTVIGDFAAVAGEAGPPRSMAELECRLHPDDRAARQALTADLRAGRRAEYEVEFRVRRSDGNFQWLATRGKAVLGPDGAPTGRFTGVTFDCTARKEAEARAAAAEAQARFALSAARMSAWEWELSTGRVIRSDALGHWLGLPPGALTDQAGALLPLLHPADRAQYEADVLARVRSGAEYEWDFRLRHADGSWRWVRSRGRGMPGPDGTVDRVAGVHIDVTAEKQAEERLRLLESAVVHARDAIVILAAGANESGGRSVWYANAAFERMTGYSPAEVVGRSLSFLGGPKSDPWALGRLRAALVAGEPLVTELLNYHKDGTEVWVELSLVPVPDGAGAVSHFVMIQRDVTDRKRAEAAVRASEERLRAIGDSLPDGAVFQFAIDAAGRPHIPYISAGVERVVGVPATAIQADAAALLGLMHPDDRGAFADRKRRSAADLSTCEMEFRFAAADGRQVPCYARSQPVRLPDGGTLWNGILLDVTDRKRTEEALRQSEARFRGMFESAAAGVTEVGPDGTYTAVNPAYAAMLGRRPADILGRSPGEFTHPDDWAAQAPVLAEVAAGTRDEYQHPKRYLRPDGTVVWTELTVTVLRDAAGRVRSSLGVSVDVSRRRQLEDQLRQAQKMEAVGQLAGGIAHDFNNLLTGLIGHLGLIRLPAGDPGEDHLATAERAAHRAAELTQKLLGFARKSQLLLVPVAAADCVAEAVDLLRPSLPASVRLEVDLDGAGAVLADPTLIAQAVLNLGLNAKDAMPDGGTLTVSATDVEFHHPDPPARPGRFVRLRVADTGVGMAADVLARVFEPFFTTKEVGKGTGLGLPMVDGIVRQHGGWLTVASDPGRGTRFDLFLPAADRPATDDTPPPVLKRTPVALPPPPAVGPAAATVLLVDDEEMIRLLGRSVLEDAGYTVLEAEDGADAVAVFARRHADIDLVVLDLTMPRMSGREAFRRMAEVRPTARVLLSSGYTADDLSDVTGAVGLLAKPYRPAELVSAVRRALNGTLS